MADGAPQAAAEALLPRHQHTRHPHSRRHALLALGGVLLMLVLLKVGVAVQASAGAALGALVTLGTVLITRAARTSWHDLGISRHTLRVGATWAAAAAAVVAVGYLLTALAFSALPAVAALVQQVDLSGLDPRTAVQRALVMIPMGTVLVEEVAFRGALPALLRRMGAGTRSAIGAASLLFGLWHVAPALAAAQVALSGPAVWVAVAGTVVFTTIGGVGLGWLRHRTGSLLPPVAVHLATNSLGVALIWYVGQF